MSRPPPSTRPTPPSSSSSSSSSSMSTSTGTLVPLATLSPPIPGGSPAWHVAFSIDGRYLAACVGNPDTRVLVWEKRRRRRRRDGGSGASLSRGRGRRPLPGEDATDATKAKKSAEDDVDVVDEDEEGGREWELISTIRDDDDDDDEYGGRRRQNRPGSTSSRRTIRCAAFAPTCMSSLILATASFDGKVVVWERRRRDCYDGRDRDVDDDVDDDDDCEYDEYDDRDVNSFEAITQLEGHESEVKCLTWNATGSLLASCGRDKTIWIWECRLPGTVGGGDGNAARDGDMGGGEGAGEFDCLAVLQGHGGDVKSITFGQSHGQFGDGDEVLYSASYDNTVKVWAEEDGEWYCASTLDDTVHSSTVWCVALSPGGVRMYTGSQDGSIGIWKMRTSAELSRRRGSSSSSSTRGVGGGGGGSWDCVGRLSDSHSGYPVMSIDCAPSRAGHGRVASCGGDDRINVYREEVVNVGGTIMSSSSDAPKFALEAVAVDAHDGDVNCVRWHPLDGTCLASCGDDGAVRLWRYRR
ncbi:hypothetical protein ACHAW5_006389 [Stephanodiscus triporus]|uniref:Probable cytosolic iron-sulfur protein assembly protein CIAO1 homolog n=1 Tax=Stephanodiscus triporus TaxID=2934178 RepID=A0ABD3QTK4_9STRA